MTTEEKIKKVHYRLELIRTIVPIIGVVLQCVILWKVFYGG